MANAESQFRLIRINNQNRITGSPTDFACDFTDDHNTHKVSEVHIQSVSLAHVFYNIRDHNNTLKVNLGVSGVQTILLNEGWYNTGLMITELTDLINPLLGGGSSITITQNSLTGKLMFDITVGTDTIEFLSIVTDPESTASPFIGVTSGGVASLGFPYTAEELNNLIGPQHIYIESSTLNNGQTLLSAQGTMNNTCINIPVNVPYKGNIVYQSSDSGFTDRFVYSIVRDISTIDIKVKDSGGRILHMGDNHELIITLKAYYNP